MNARILLIANLFLVSLLIWPPGGSLLSFRFSTPDMLLRMAVAIWLWVGAVLIVEHHVLGTLRDRRRDRSIVETRDGDWNARGDDRRTGDRRQQNEGPPAGFERRQRERRSDARRADDGLRQSESDEGDWRLSAFSQAD